MAIYISGDCHGEFENIEFFCRHHPGKPDDCMILLGDVGLNYCLDKRDNERKERLAQNKILLFCVHGNHEERPYNLPTYREKEWHGGMVYYEEEYPNLLFAKDGEIYDFDGKKVIVIGGAYSVDKAFRCMVGMPWFPEEQPSEKIKRYVEKQLENSDWRVDYVLSHTCPMRYIPRDRLVEVIDQNRVDRTTEEWMEQLAEKMQYTCWYFGHYHDNKSYATAELLYDGIKELGKDGYVQLVGRPRYRVGELVIFEIGDGEEKEYGDGRIEKVHPYGTEAQCREVSYDISGILWNHPEKKRLFCDVTETNVQSIHEPRALEEIVEGYNLSM